jgi:hypothetical protein
MSRVMQLFQGCQVVSAARLASVRNSSPARLLLIEARFAVFELVFFFIGAKYIV